MIVTELNVYKLNVNKLNVVSSIYVISVISLLAMEQYMNPEAITTLLRYTFGGGSKQEVDLAVSTLQNIKSSQPIPLIDHLCHIIATHSEGITFAT